MALLIGKSKDKKFNTGYELDHNLKMNILNLESEIKRMEFFLDRLKRIKKSLETCLLDLDDR